MKTIHDLFNFIKTGRGTEQNPKYHPEGSVYIHTILTFYNALHATDSKDIITAAIFHDIGKINYHYDVHGHSARGVELVKNILTEKQTWLIQHHMRIKDFLDGSMKKQSKREYLLYHPWLEDLLMLHTCDQNARTPQGMVILMKAKTMEKWFHDNYKAETPALESANCAG